MFFKSKKKKYYEYLIRKIERSYWDMELRIITISEIREGIRREFDRVSEAVKGLDDEIKKEREEEKLDTEKIEKLTGLKGKYETDAENMKNQMIGKWSEKEQTHLAGIDQEIADVKQKIEGGKAFKGLIKREMKKL